MVSLALASGGCLGRAVGGVFRTDQRLGESEQAGDRFKSQEAAHASASQSKVMHRMFSDL